MNLYMFSCYHFVGLPSTPYNLTVTVIQPDQAIINWSVENVLYTKGIEMHISFNDVVGNEEQFHVKTQNIIQVDA